ncbi:MAG: ankyrin repeat domain-containing protein [Gammaproteobacteria bacterium]|nr:ankyrin repeat domain-containing protein [Gammaproteobacteria bacterium]
MAFAQIDDDELRKDFIRYVQYNHLDEVKSYLVDYPWLVNYTFKYSSTALCVAIRFGHINLAKYLLQNGANIEHHDENENTPLLLALSWGYKDIVRMLLTAGANPLTNDAKNNSPYELAIKRGAPILAGIIADHVKNFLGYAILKALADARRLKRIERSKKGPFTFFSPSPLLSIKGTEGATHEALGNEIARLNSTPGTHLPPLSDCVIRTIFSDILAGSYNDKIRKHDDIYSCAVELYLELVVTTCHPRQIALAYKALPSFNSLFTMAPLSTRPMIALLCQNVNKYNTEVYKTDETIKFKELLAEASIPQSAHSRSMENRLINMVGYNASIEDIKMLISDDTIDVNTADTLGNTALMSAACQGRQDIIDLLIKNGADVNRTDRYGNTALTLAARNGMTNVIATLIATKDSLVMRIHIAILSGLAEYVKIASKRGTIKSSDASYILVSDHLEILNEVAAKHGLSFDRLTLKKIQSDVCAGLYDSKFTLYDNPARLAAAIILENLVVYKPKELNYSNAYKLCSDTAFIPGVILIPAMRTKLCTSISKAEETYNMLLKGKGALIDAKVLQDKLDQLSFELNPRKLNVRPAIPSAPIVTADMKVAAGAGSEAANQAADAQALILNAPSSSDLSTAVIENASATKASSDALTSIEVSELKTTANIAIGGDDPTDTPALGAERYIAHGAGDPLAAREAKTTSKMELDLEPSITTTDISAGAADTGESLSSTTPSGLAEASREVTSYENLASTTFYTSANITSIDTSIATSSTEDSLTVAYNAIVCNERARNSIESIRQTDSTASDGIRIAMPS